MARLVTVGAESQRLGEYGLIAWQNGGLADESRVALVATTDRPGQWAFRVHSNGDSVTNYYCNFPSQTFAYDTEYYLRASVYFESWPTNEFQLIRLIGTDTTSRASARVSSTGVLRLANHFSGGFPGTTAQLALNTWHRIEFRFRINSGGGSASSLGLKVDGTSLANSLVQPLGTIQVSDAQLGYGTDPGNAMYMRVDDVALNDGSGANQNTYPGEGYVNIISAISDSSRTGWTAGAAGTTSLWDAINNLPPAGVAVGNATIATQLEDANNNATDSYVATLQGLQVSGAVSGSLTLIELFAEVALGAAASAQTIGLALSGPVTISEQQGTTLTSTGGISPTNWTYIFGRTYGSSISSTTPLLTLYRRTASATTIMVDHLGVQLEWSTNTAASYGAGTYGNINETYGNVRGIYSYLGGAPQITADPVPDGDNQSYWNRGVPIAPAGSLDTTNQSYWNRGVPLAQSIVETPTGVAVITSTDTRASDDSATVSGVAVPSATDVAIFVDASTAIGVAVVSGTDAATFVDSSTATGTGVVSGTELTDADTAIGVAAVSGTDAATFVDAATSTAAADVSGSDAITAQDSGSVIAVGLPSGTDYAEYSDGATITANATVSGSDEQVSDDSFTVSAQAVVSGSDSAIFVDAAESAALADVSADEQGPGDFATVIGQAQASALDAFTAFDAATVIAVALVSAVELAPTTRHVRQLVINVFTNQPLLAVGETEGPLYLAV